MTRKGWSLFAAMSVLWGLPYLFIKVAVAEVDPVVVVFVRTGLAVLVLLPIALRRGALRHARGRWREVLALAVIEVTGPFLLISFGETYVPSSLAGLLVAAVPLVIAVVAFRLDPSERVTGLRLSGLVVGMVGVGTLLGLDVGADPRQLLGAGLVLLSTVGYALGAIRIKRLADVPPLGVITALLAINTVLLAPVAAFRLPQQRPSTYVVASLLVLGLACTALAFPIFFALIAEAGAGRGTVITYVNPAVAVALGVMLLGEPITAATVAGFLLIIAGSWLSTGGRLPPRRLPALTWPRPGRWTRSARSATDPEAAA